MEPEHVRCNSHSPLHSNLLRPLGSWPPQLRLFPSNSCYSKCECFFPITP